jgi:C1A family cysteine protease
LQSVKSYLSQRIPSVFGYTVYQSIENATKTGEIPFPSGKEKIMGGHAISAFGMKSKS